MEPEYLGTIAVQSHGRIGVKGLTVREQMMLLNTMGRILPEDVGKQVWLVGDVIQVESTEQRDTRRIGHMLVTGG